MSEPLQDQSCGLFSGPLDGNDPAAIAWAVQRLAAGGLLAFPTETVYGLGARADQDAAVASIFSLKSRPTNHPLIVHVADAQAAEPFAHFTSLARRLVAAAWPGPVSLVLQRRAGVAEAAAGGHATLALRCPSHPVAQALLRQCLALGIPGIAAPSANRFGRTSPTLAQHVAEEFGSAVPVLDGGPCEAGIESAIVDCSGQRPRLLRPGSLSRGHLAQLLGAELAAADLPASSGAGRGADPPRVSGTHDSHYAPDAAMQLVPSAQLLAWAQRQRTLHGAGRVAVWSRRPLAVEGILWRAQPDDAATAGHQLFALMRAWDAQGVALMGIEQTPDDPAWEGVKDRLSRAAHPIRQLHPPASRPTATILSIPDDAATS